MTIGSFHFCLEQKTRYFAKPVFYDVFSAVSKAVFERCTHRKKKVGKYQSCLSAPSYVPPIFEISRLPTTLWMTSGNLTKCEVSQELRLNETKLTHLKSCIFDVPLLFCIHVIYTVSFSVIS